MAYRLLELDEVLGFGTSLTPLQFAKKQAVEQAASEICALLQRT